MGRPSAPETLILELIATLSGAALLALEIVASRVLAPAFGNSVYVWGSLIGVFLAALSLGYFLGGRVADRWPSPTVFGGVVFAAGVATFPIPLLAPRVLGEPALEEMSAWAGSLVAALLLFFLPGVALGMVCPFAIRLRARSVATVGHVAGRFYAVSTVGSIAGTLGTAFVLLDVLGVRAIIYGLGAGLMALAVLALLAGRRAGPAALAVVAATGIGTGALLAAPDALPGSVVYERDTAYHRIVVTDRRRIRVLRLDNYWHSALDLDRPDRTVLAYGDHLRLPALFVSRLERVAMIGLGGGTVLRQYVRDHPDAEVEVAELDPAVVEVARRFFQAPMGDRVRVVVEDGRRFLQRTPRRYDAILLDAYLTDAVPFHLTTREFFELAAARLRPGGVVASNVGGALAGPRGRLFRAIYKTMRAVFPSVHVFPVQYARVADPGITRDIVLVASLSGTRSRGDLVERGRRLLAEGRGHLADVVEAAADLYLGAVETGDAPVLTDDFAPVETLAPPR